MNEHEQSELLPRWELREAQCRRFENLIAQACGGSLVVTPQEWYETSTCRGKGMSARTMVLRFNDAVLGFRRYGYESGVIPQGFNLKNISAKEYSHGKVFIENKGSLVLAQNALDKLPSVNDKEKIKQLILNMQDESAVIEVKANSESECDWIVEVMKQNPKIDESMSFWSEKRKMFCIFPVVMKSDPVSKFAGVLKE